MLGRTTPLLSLMLALSAASVVAAAPYRAPRTSFGTPDLEGAWSNLSLTLLERPARYKGLIATEAEVAASQARRKARIEGKPQPPAPVATSAGKAPPQAADAPPDPDVLDGVPGTSEYAERSEVDFLRIYGQPRTSLIVQPGDGRLPYTPAGEKLAEAATAADDHDFSNPESRMPDERCLSAGGGTVGPPMLDNAQNANLRIVQTKTDIAIYLEVIHDVRIVHMGASHPAAGAHAWMGDSIGWWEGETLVIETVDQNPLDAPRFEPNGVFYLSQAAKVTERLTRISPTQIHYEFVVEDPAIYRYPWRGETMLSASKAPIYEYACHEGNYALANILAGARVTEKAQPPASAKTP